MLGSPVLLSGKRNSLRRSPRDPPGDQNEPTTPTPLDLAVVFDGGQDVASVLRFSRPRHPTLDITNQPKPLDDEYISEALGIQTPNDYDVRLLPSNGVSPKAYLGVTKRRLDYSDLLNRMELLEKKDVEKSEEIAVLQRKDVEKSEEIAVLRGKDVEKSEEIAELKGELSGIHAALAGNQVAADLISYCDGYLRQKHTGVKVLCDLLNSTFPTNSFLHDFSSIVLNVAVCNLHRLSYNPLVNPAILPKIRNNSRHHLKRCIRDDSTTVRNLESLEQATLDKITSAINECRPEHIHFLETAIMLRTIKFHNGIVRNKQAHPDIEQKHVISFISHYQSEGFLTTTMGHEAAKMALARWPDLNRGAFASFLR